MCSHCETLLRTLKSLSPFSSLPFRVWPGVCLWGGPQGGLCIPWHHASPAETAEESCGPARRRCPPSTAEGPKAWPPPRPESCQQPDGSWIHGANSGEGRHQVRTDVSSRGKLLLSRILKVPGEFLSGPFYLPRFGEYRQHWLSTGHEVLMWGRQNQVPGEQFLLFCYCSRQFCDLWQQVDIAK